MSSRNNPASESVEHPDHVRDKLNSLPDTLHGWTRWPAGESPQRPAVYWRNSATHIAADYEQLAIIKTRDEQYRVDRAQYDQFRITHGTTGLSRPLDADRFDDIIWRLKHKAKKNPGDNEFEQPPAFPIRCNRWTAITRQHFEGASRTQWIYDATGEHLHNDDWGSEPRINPTAAYEMQAIGVGSSKVNPSQMYSLTYVYPDNRKIIHDVLPKTMALELVTTLMETHETPPHQQTDVHEELQTVAGIGPARAERLAILGIQSLAELSEFVEHNSNASPIANHYHADRVEAFVTQPTINDLGSQ